MLKIGCLYSPKITRFPIAEYPKYFQVAELGNTFYRILSTKDINKLAKLSRTNKNFEFTMKVHRFITHKYQFHHNNLREKALTTIEKVIATAKSLECNKILIQTHYTQEYDKAFFENVLDFFNSINLNGIKIFWELRGLNWRYEEIRLRLKKLFADLNIGHVIDLLISRPLNINQEGIVYTRLHGFGARWNNYLHNIKDLLRFIREANALLKEIKEIYVIFPTEEMYNDAIFLNKLWEEIGAREINFDEFHPSFRIDFLLKYIFSGQHLEITYAPPFALKPEKDRIKLSSRVLKNMQSKIEEYVELLNIIRNAEKIDEKFNKKYFDELRKLGEYLAKYLLGDKVKYRYRLTRNDNVINETDEKSLCYPYEWIYDGRNFICLKNKTIHKLLENKNAISLETPKIERHQKIKILFLNRTNDNVLDRMVSNISEKNTETVIVNRGGLQDIKKELAKNYDIIIYLGAIQLDQDELIFRWGKTPIPFSEFIRELKSPPKLVIIGNTYQQHKMRYLLDSFRYAIPFLRSGSNFLTNFVSLSRKELVEFITEFLCNFLMGKELPSALWETRRRLFERYWGKNPSWLCFALFGDETFRIEGGE
ncbi:MAG: DUF72 domain-containing protein [Candidatus Helarchaeota archaeon]